LALAPPLQTQGTMQPINSQPTLVVPAANDLPASEHPERARRRERERRLRGPAWVEPHRAQQSA